MGRGKTSSGNGEIQWWEKVSNNITIVKLNRDEWTQFSENAHLIVFNERKPPEMERVDFALLAEIGVHQLLGYVTCRELDKDTLYWQYGGAFPRAAKTSMSFSFYMRFIWWTKQHYKRVSFLVENTNTVMLKMALKAGFKIVGIRNYKNHILLEHHLEFE